MTDLPYLTSRIYGTPLLIARPKLEVILGVMGKKLAGETLSALPSDALPGEGGVQITESGIAVIPILGTLVRRSSYLAAGSGLTSYHTIEAMAESAFTDPRVKAVLLEIDSSGGEAGGVFDLATRLRSLAKTSGKPLWAIADEAALSAAYALACAADQVWLTRTAEVGSIGVVAVHVDESEADKKDGLAYTFIHAGNHKVDGHPHAPLSAAVAADIQADIDGLYDQFVSMVAGFRHMSPKAVRATEARVYRGNAAIAAGLADRIGSLRDATAALSQAIMSQIRSNPLAPQIASATRFTPQEILMSDLPQVIDVPGTQTDVHGDAPPARPVSLPDTADTAGASTVDEAAITAKVESRLRAELAELTEIAAQARRLGVAVDPAQALSSGVTPDVLRKTVLKQAAERDAAADIVAQNQTEPGQKAANLADSPLVKAAKQAHQSTHMQGTR